MDKKDVNMLMNDLKRIDVNNTYEAIRDLQYILMLLLIKLRED